MQLMKGLFIAAVICVAGAVSAKQQETDNHPDSTRPVTNGFGMQVGFASNDDPDEVDEENSAQKTNYTVFVVGGVAGCVCIGIIGAVYMKRRKDKGKLQGDIFTIDDKNSVL
ncbi:hypothetical protein KXD40_008399 [Peronospora effusa]|uniref:RxLR effector candidate protein n=2 Tax=Peronospora TaxID=70742 RepID=A0A3M6VQ40_9STRA|nr:hypothetical protein DD238_003979 [Peronospora effusa]CAH0491806.1 unnamed protein product [Peronospora farinosa]RQM10539.1 hypothetical protein DD237_005195 [Peronospora effusa]UIZ24274.1 hypothetical protein KXD40_008399 [Peronospora effusa]CAI5707679.1 unnamed protein product [Peronospora farinosa]